MKNIACLFFCAAAMLMTGPLLSQGSFQVVPLGVRGGGDEGNLSAYMVAPVNSEDYVCLDAGTLHAGIEKAIGLKTFDQPASYVLKHYIKGFFISHGHLDHLAGMIINSPDDTVKNIYAFPFVVDVLKEKYFSWRSWANFGDAGEAPALKKYHYVLLDSIGEMLVANTSLHVRAFVLSHASPYQSSAFLLRQDESYVLYLGDTGSDTLEHSDRLRHLWQSIAPLVRDKKLKGIFIETSFPDEQPDKLLFGHLTPRLLMNEMGVLDHLCNKEGTLNGLPIIITHQKPVGDNEQRIKEQLRKNNPFKLKLIFPEQGRKIIL